MDWQVVKRLPVMAAVILAMAAVGRAETLDARLNGLLGSQLVKGASVGISVVEVKAGGGGGTGGILLYEHNAALPLGPASNCKLLTTAAAFETYGAKAVFKTALYKVGDDLVIVGGGDPGLGDSKLTDGNPTAAFAQWADALKKIGVTQYRDLIVDDRVFDEHWTHPNWPAGDRMHWDSAPVGGLNFNANCLDWLPGLSQAGGVEVQLIPNTSYVSVAIRATRGEKMAVSMVRPPESNKFEMRGTVSAAKLANPFSVPIYDPGLWTGTILRDVLAEGGVKGTGAVRRLRADEKPGAGSLVAEHDTPLLSVMARANKNSLNMMAECTCKRLGHDASGQPGSWENGTAAVMAYVKRIGVEPGLVSLDDGSGLSNRNRVAAKAFTTVLAHIAQRPDGDLFIATLAVPGEDGTLKARFKEASVAGHIHAKTGHINGVSTLSGFIDAGTGDNKRLFAFSILCNKYVGNVNPWQDQVCQAIYQWAQGK